MLMKKRSPRRRIPLPMTAILLTEADRTLAAAQRYNVVAVVEDIRDAYARVTRGDAASLCVGSLSTLRMPLDALMPLINDLSAAKASLVVMDARMDTKDPLSSMTLSMFAGLSLLNRSMFLTPLREALCRAYLDGAAGPDTDTMHSNAGRVSESFFGEGPLERRGWRRPYLHDHDQPRCDNTMEGGDSTCILAEGHDGDCDFGSKVERTRSRSAL